MHTYPNCRVINPPVYKPLAYRGAYKQGELKTVFRSKAPTPSPTDIRSLLLFLNINSKQSSVPKQTLTALAELRCERQNLALAGGRKTARKAE